MSCDMWFGTQEFSTWVPTPLSGADVSPQAWSASGVLLNGGAFARHSFNKHKEFNFSWRTTSSRETAQLMHSFYDGSFGRGKLYFHDPLTYTTNVLPARWADPSITCDYEGPSLIPGVIPSRMAVGANVNLRTPVTAAAYNLNGVTPVTGATTTVGYVNRAINPRMTTATGIGVGPGGGTASYTVNEPLPAAGFPVETAVKYTWSAPSTSVSGGIGLITPVVAGEMIYPSAYVMPTREQSMRMQLQFRTGSTNTGSVIYGPVIHAPAFQATRIHAGPVEVPAGVDGVTIRCWAGGDAPGAGPWQVGDSLYVSAYSTAPGDFFDGATGSVVVAGDAFQTRWVGSATSSASEAYRVTGATTTPVLNDSNSLFIPIPDGMQLNLGAWYTATGSAGIFLSGVTATGVNSNLLQVYPLSSGLFNTTVTKQPGEVGVRLWLGKTTSANASLTVNAIHARLSKTGETPGGENFWVGGQGHSGSRFAQPPTYINNTGRDGGQVEFAATFVESVI